MALSANGWPVLITAPPRQLIPGTNIKLSVRAGDVATVLLEAARRFNAEVEPLALPVGEKPGYDDWGWAYRPIRGQVSGFSNHASGTAIDLNATRHPRGVKGTFELSERALVRKILASMKDKVTGREVVRWGEDFASTVDGMHFEINASPAAVNRVASRIREKQAEAVRPAPVPKPVITEEGDDMKSDDKLTLGQWGKDVLRDADGQITYAQALAVQTVATAQMNETIHALAGTIAEMQITQAAILAELKRLK